MTIKNLLIIPGFGQSEKDGFIEIGAAAHELGLTATFVPIRWSRSTISQGVRQFEEWYKNYDPDTTAIFGFSAGAQIGLIAAAYRNPAALILASMPGWFAEDLSERSDFHKKVVGKRRVADYKTLHFDKLADRIVSKVYILYAEKEIIPYPHFLHRAQDAHAKLKDSMLTVVPRAGHDITNTHYREAVIETLGLLVR